jgi:hypothetical protein
MFEIGPTRPSNLFTKARNRFLAQFYPTRIVKDPSQFSEVYSKNNNCNKIHDIRYVSNLKDKWCFRLGHREVTYTQKNKKKKE